MSCTNTLALLAGIAAVVSVTAAPVTGAMPWSDASALNTNASTDGNVGDYYPHMAHDGQGNWVCVWCAANVSLNPRDFDILVSRSSDDGATWTAPAVLDPLGADPLEVEDDFHPYVYTDGAGHWIAAWYSYETHGGTLGTDIDILVSRSTDNGATWTPSEPLNSDATTDHVDYTYCNDTSPNLAYDGNGHWVAVWYTRRTDTDPDDYDIYITRSSDHGATWSQLELLHSDLATDLGYDSSPCIAADTSGNWVITWKSDSLIGTNGIGDEDIHFSRSTDNGLNWSAPTALNTDASTDGLRDAYSGGIDLLTDGTVWLVVWVRELPPLVDYDLIISRSTDAGLTWSPPEILNPYYDVDGGGKDLYPRLGADGHGGWVVVWEEYEHFIFPWGSDHDLVFMRSDDGTLTWSDPDVLNSHAYVDLVARDEKPMIAATPQGRWMTIWFSTYDIPGSGIGSERDIFYATSCVPTTAGDHECDGDTDLFDFRAFQACFTVTGPVSSDCLAFDFDGDDNVDGDDYVEFEGAFGGPVE
ncbi:MAG TPA: sialidase family protein [Phycisphaerae bacterium]|nr:sialidase family protein [Phycisphaerae bacterium]